jgi:phosphoglycolate phosphatase-like HAD superfamily hydrolase
MEGARKKVGCWEPFNGLDVLILGVLHGIRLIIYDLDGTLIDSTEAIVETFNRVVEEQGEHSCPRGEIEEMIGLPLTEMFKRVLPTDKHCDVQACWNRFIEIYADVGPKKTRIFPGVPETLAHFKEAGYLQSVATTKRGDVASRLLHKLGLRDYFDLVLGINDVAQPKPAPDVINLTLKRLSVKPQEAVFIEDTTIGLEAGVRAGVHTVGVTTGTHDMDRLAALHPDYIIDGLHELKKLISR